MRIRACAMVTYIRTMCSEQCILFSHLYIYRIPITAIHIVLLCTYLFFIIIIIIYDNNLNNIFILFIFFLIFFALYRYRVCLKYRCHNNYGISVNPLPREPRTPNLHHHACIYVRRIL